MPNQKSLAFVIVLLGVLVILFILQKQPTTYWEDLWKYNLQYERLQNEQNN